MNTEEKLNYLLSPQAVRERSRKLFDKSLANQGAFMVHPERWNLVTDYVYQTILEKYPALDIPFHSRLGHFRAGTIDRLKWPILKLESLVGLEKVKLLFDLIVPSVLLDAGAGDQWSFFESLTGKSFARSEGLGLASLHMFLDKKFSSENQFTTDALALEKLTLGDLEGYFQVNSNNPLIGLDGRHLLLKKLGQVMAANTKIFPNGRPSDLLALLLKENNEVNAEQVLKIVLLYFGAIWPSRLSLNHIPLGDTWSHPHLGTEGSFESLVPFHKLSQWLSYSLLDACQMGGLKITKVQSLTGLPEYRNGGLFLDLELITLKDPQLATCGLAPGRPEVIEWRALTVTLLDELAVRLQDKLGLSPEQLPLAKVLEGGSWWAGRKIAAEKRKGASSPLKIISDGTVF
jgi:hypothetical protein